MCGIWDAGGWEGQHNLNPNCVPFVLAPLLNACTEDWVLDHTALDSAGNKNALVGAAMDESATTDWNGCRLIDLNQVSIVLVGDLGILHKMASMDSIANY